MQALLHVLCDFLVPVGQHRVDIEMLEVSIVALLLILIRRQLLLSFDCET